MEISKIIKNLRGEMTQAELAKRAGLNFTTISKLEKGFMTGTIDTHRKIAKGLGISLSELYKGLDEKAPAKYEINTSSKSKTDTFYYDEKATSQILLEKISRHNMVPELLRLEKNGSTHLEEKPQGTEQFIFVLEGYIELKIDSQAQQLKKGESIYFDASRPHIIRNLTKKTARCLRVTSPAAL